VKLVVGEVLKMNKQHMGCAERSAPGIWPRRILRRGFVREGWCPGREMSTTPGNWAGAEFPVELSGECSGVHLSWEMSAGGLSREGNVGVNTHTHTHTRTDRLYY